ncbi:hypothetical protein [Sulfitobacter sp.]|uniref:hypothetical protein n=1 Tax=Sulfitobacter sp. TaxID=1903071 RepID=UPI0030027BCF
MNTTFAMGVAGNVDCFTTNQLCRLSSICVRFGVFLMHARFAGILRVSAVGLLFTISLLFAVAGQGHAQGIAPSFPSEAGLENTLGDQSDSDIWRAIRQGAAGLPSSSEVTDGILINAEGVWWSELRRPEGPLIQYGGTALAVIVAAVALFYLIRGRLRIDGGRSGRMVSRFSLVQRVVHWVIATLFLLLGFTGLLLLFGRPLLIPLIGKSAFSILATASMQAHNLFGPVFILSLGALFFTFVRGNFPSWSDINWVI